MHFAILDRRLRALGAGYGALPAHAGPWDAAAATAEDAMGRIAVVLMVLEGWGLDVTSDTAARFRAAGDEASARILQRIHTDDIRHVRIGVKWFGALAAKAGLEPAPLWREKAARYFRGALKPPFNDSARSEAGLTRDYDALIAC